MAVTRKPKSVEEFIHGGNLDQVIEHAPGNLGSNLTSNMAHTATEDLAENAANKIGHSLASDTANAAAGSLAGNNGQNASKKESTKTANASAETSDIQPVKLRLPQTLLEQIDGCVAKRKPAPSRHQWILEAMYEKLSREVS